jgi:hypothetical protein
VYGVFQHLTTQDQAVNEGFATIYGATEPIEDFAEYIGTTEAPSATTPGVCGRFETPTELTKQLAIPYAKLVMARAVGALRSSSFDACVQGVEIDTSQPGIRFPTIGFDQNFVAEAQQTDAGYAFMIRADGPNSYQLGFKVDLRSKNDSPLGLHRFDASSPGHYFTPGFSGAGLLNTVVVKSRVSQTGMILFTEDSSKRVAGAVFGLILENAFGDATDWIPYAPFVIPR